VHFSSATPEWATPADLFAKLDREFAFTLDVAATGENAKCRQFFTRKENGLSQQWSGRVFCNPPYGREIGHWIAKGWESVQAGACDVVVCLVPARVDTAWWQAQDADLSFIADDPDVWFWSERFIEPGGVEVSC
jgi:phage N-6-adenine-methyltransferase